MFWVNEVWHKKLIDDYYYIYVGIKLGLHSFLKIGKNFGNRKSFK